jgi:hypothetical protein
MKWFTFSEMLHVSRVAHTCEASGAVHHENGAINDQDVKLDMFLHHFKGFRMYASY